MTGCAVKQPIISQSVTIIFKTPHMKFYDKGFIAKYDDYIHMQIFSVGVVILDLKVYANKICKDTLRCLDNDEFNKQYISSEYEKDFLYQLLSKDKINFRDKENKILIKIKKD